VSFRTELITDSAFGLQMFGANFFLTLPWRGMRFAAGKSFLEFVRDEALRRASNGAGGEGVLR